MINISKLVREAFNEAYFTDDNLRTHYEKHVLGPDEKFNPSDPKFPYMTEQEYEEHAEDLSWEPAKSYKQYKDTDENAVFGWAIKNDRDSEERFIKLRNSSELVPGYPEVVIYSKEGVIISYMLLRKPKDGDKEKSRVYKYRNDFVRELKD